MADPNRSPAADRPLSALLSYALVAFTIEFDNEAEHRLPHTTTLYGAAPGALHAPWLVSLVMWTNCMQHLQDGPLTVSELELRARTSANLAGMERWGYVRVQPDPSDSRPKPPHSEWLVSPKPGGHRAIEVWRVLEAEIENRWRDRFGADRISDLRRSLAALVPRLEPALPDCLPILKYGLFCTEARRPAKTPRTAAASTAHTDQLPLPALFAKPLLSLAIDYESGAPVSLAIAANVLRLVPDHGLRIKDLPTLAGVSRESIAMAMTFLKSRKLADEIPESTGGRFRAIRLTGAGRILRDEHPHRLRQIEQNWRKEIGGTAIDRLHAQLSPLAADGTAQSSPLFAGLRPYPEGWRARIPQPKVLPDFPIVLHRGGWPDGS